RTGLRASVNQNHNFGVEQTAKGMEQPAMRVDLFTILLLQAEHQLHGRKAPSDVAVSGRADELLVRGHGDLAGEFKDMSYRLLVVDVLLHNTVLIYPNRGEDIEDVLVDLVDAIEDQTDHNLLPGRTVVIPESRLLEIHNVTNVLHGP